jgi:hypothetical protein
MYFEPTTVPTVMSSWELATQPIRTDHIYCGATVTIGYPDPVVPFGNNAVVNPGLGVFYLILVVALLVIIPTISFMKKIKFRIVISYASLFIGLFISTNIIVNSPYGHLNDMWPAWTLLVLDSLLLLAGVTGVFALFNKNMRKALLA